jgi:hypothetical protein
VTHLVRDSSAADAALKQGQFFICPGSGFVDLKEEEIFHFDNLLAQLFHRVKIGCASQPIKEKITLRREFTLIVVMSNQHHQHLDVKISSEIILDDFISNLLSKHFVALLRSRGGVGSPNTVFNVVHSSQNIRIRCVDVLGRIPVHFPGSVGKRSNLNSKNIHKKVSFYVKININCCVYHHKTGGSRSTIFNYNRQAAAMQHLICGCALDVGHRTLSADPGMLPPGAYSIIKVHNRNSLLENG